ncbi:MAG: DUF3108 domain-containing protein [Ignavibacteria bacterium]|nr:DUF3108 domain-containing protein [Ignavibacteria bacterium]
MLTVLRNIVLLIFATALITLSAWQREASINEREELYPLRCDSGMICPGEELTYEVRWWAFKLGQIRLKILDSKIKDGQIYHSAAAFINSYDGLPFVDVHAIDSTQMDSSFYSLGFQALEKKNDIWLTERSRYDRHHKKLIIERSLQKDAYSSPSTQPTFDTLSIKREPFHDGLSILYFARANIHRSSSIRVPTIVYGKLGRTTFPGNNKSTTMEIDALKAPVRVIEVEGIAEFEGLYGFTGDFKGWFSDDVAAVPIKAELEVLIGSVTLELQSWKRQYWKIPFVKK